MFLVRQSQTGITQYLDGFDEARYSGFIKGRYYGRVDYKGFAKLEDETREWNAR